ncbi:hypothetical protein ADEAN_000355900 [Angomonas deanei]|uniref:Uncharacterized protein n=1 Tax=Angomonas deanei TaxID=59799 RepID=A0A7G2C8N6_9TRYP|nr:hypothetical protein ADEAN_000355900 [Angomonas deanei]
MYSFPNTGSPYHPVSDQRPNPNLEERFTKQYQHLKSLSEQLVLARKLAEGFLQSYRQYLAKTEETVLAFTSLVTAGQHAFAVNTDATRQTVDQLRQLERAVSIFTCNNNNNNNNNQNQNVNSFAAIERQFKVLILEPLKELEDGVAQSTGAGKECKHVREKLMKAEKKAMKSPSNTNNNNNFNNNNNNNMNFVDPKVSMLRQTYQQCLTNFMNVYDNFYNFTLMNKLNIIVFIFTKSVSVLSSEMLQLMNPMSAIFGNNTNNNSNNNNNNNNMNAITNNNNYNNNMSMNGSISMNNNNNMISNNTNNNNGFNGLNRSSSFAANLTE